jgi:hypothetical protein
MSKCYLNEQAAGVAIEERQATTSALARDKGHSQPLEDPF